MTGWLTNNFLVLQRIILQMRSVSDNGRGRLQSLSAQANISICQHEALGSHSVIHYVTLNNSTTVEENHHPGNRPTMNFFLLLQFQATSCYISCCYCRLTLKQQLVLPPTQQYGLLSLIFQLTDADYRPVVQAFIWQFGEQETILFST